ncbi:MAG: cyclic pyranopterin monophosphate synthase MoaC [Eubacteriales bacterium]
MELTHVNEQGRAKMVDVGDKDITIRVAEAIGYVYVNPETFQLIQQGGHKKGDVLGTAQIAGIMAAKKTYEIIPMCHTILLTGVDIAFALDETLHRVEIRSTVKCQGVTGVEMEALTAVSVAALTIYDMCKAVQKDMRIEGVKLLHKTGGKSGEWHADGEE